MHAACLHVPLGLSEEGLPIGLQVISASADEQNLIAAGRAVGARATIVAPSCSNGDPGTK